MCLRYNKSSYFTISLLILVIISSFLSIIVLPQMIVGPPSRINEVKLIYLVDIWRSQGIALPSLTLFIIIFGEAYFLRYFLIVILILGLVTLEIINRNQIVNFIIYMFILVLSIALGYLILIAALIPMIPL